MIPARRLQRHPIVLPLVAVVLVALAILAWIPTFLAFLAPNGDQVWEQFGIWRTCAVEQFQLGWAGPGSDNSFGAFTGSLPITALQWLSCQLARHSPLNALQSFLALGLVLTFGLAFVSCRRAGFRPLTSLLTAFLITTAPCSFSRVAHLGLATLWPVIPGLLACHGLWRAMLPVHRLAGKPGSAAALVPAGAIAMALCCPGQEYYLFFILLLLAACFGLILFLATTRTSRIPILAGIATRGLAFLLGGGLLLVLAFLPKLMVVGGGGPLLAWSIPRSASEQFLYGLLPLTWLVPSPLVPWVSRALAEGGLPPNTESYFWSTGSLLIPIAWMTAIWQLARPASRAPSTTVRFFSLLLGLVSVVGLLWMTMGGLGTLFAAVVTPVLRSLNRYTVFVYGASLLVLASVLDAELQARAAATHAPLPPFSPKRLACDLRLFVAALVGACVGIELLASSRLLNIGRIRAQSAPSPSASVLPSLREMLPARERVWFAPYTTFPEIMAVESGLRQGPYDTFLAFPPDGITTNFGAFKLSPADSAFAQAAAANLPGELGLAARLGYRWFAVDLGAIKDSAGLRQQCMSRGDCRLSGDGYALFPLTGSAPLRPSDLSPYRRLLPDFAQRSAAPRWGSLVFKEDRWWPPAESSLASAGRRSLWARTGWDAEVYRFRREEVPPLLRPLLTPPRERLWLVLSPGLAGADLCLKPKVSRSLFRPSPPCQKLQLRRSQPRVEISRWILPGRITRIHTEGLYGADGMPLPPEMSIPSPPGVPGPAAFALEVENPEIPAGV